MTLYVVNNFSLNMIKDRPLAFKIDVRAVPPEQAAQLVKLAHEHDTCIVSINTRMADAFAEHMESFDVYPPETRRALIAASTDDAFLCVLHDGARNNSEYLPDTECLRYYILRHTLPPRVESEEVVCS